MDVKNINTKKNKRKCIGCNNIFDKAHLIKITKKFDTKDIYINGDNKIFGKSVYICRSEKCIKNALKKGKIYKLLRINRDYSIEKKIFSVLN